MIKKKKISLWALLHFIFYLLFAFSWILIGTYLAPYIIKPNQLILGFMYSLGIVCGATLIVIKGSKEVTQ